MEQQAATRKSMEAAGSNITHQKQKQNMGQQNLGQQKQNMGSQKQNMGQQKQNLGQQKQNMGPQKQRQQTQKGSNEPSNLFQKVKNNFILILFDYGFLFLILVANILVFMRIFQDLNTIKLDLSQIQSKGETLQKNLKPLEAAISSLGIGDTTTTPPIKPNTNPAQ